MKRFFVCTILLMCTLVGRAQKHDLLDFIFNPPWTLSAEEVLLNYPGLEDLPLLEALYPPAELLYAFPEENITFSGFTYAGHDAFVIIPHNEPLATFDNFLAIISPETTMGDDNKGVFLITLQTLGSALGAPEAENSVVDDLGGGIKVHIEDVWQSDGALFAPFYMTMDIYGSAPALYGFMVNRPYEEAPAEVAPAEVAPAEAVEPDEAHTKTLTEAILDGTAPHLLFRGKTINGPLEEFCKELEGLGYVRDYNFEPTIYHDAHFTGKYGNMACDLYVTASPLSKVAYRVEVRLGGSSLWGELKKTFAHFESLLINKYSEGERDVQYGAPYFDGSSDIFRGLYEGFVVYKNEIVPENLNDGVGFVTISIEAASPSGGGYVSILFEDYNIFFAQEEYNDLI